MSESTAPLAGSDDEFRQRLLTDAWATARMTCEAVARKIMEDTTTPAFLGQADADRKQAQFTYRRMMEVGIEALYVAEFMFATGVASGAIDPGRVVQARNYAQQFVFAATRGQRAFCKNHKGEKPCEWRGLIEEAGPAMLCPTCGERTLDFVAVQAGPPGDQPPGLRLVR